MANAGPVQWRRGDVILDLYEVRDVITTGGMGLVYRVWHRDWNVDLAVKTPRPDLVVSERAMYAFETEAATWVGLGEHPHTVSCVYVRRFGNAPRVFAEWMDAGSLAEAVKQRSLYRGARSAVLHRLLDIAIQTAWGLRHAHGSRLIHQDIKPANVLLARDTTAKVTDFGLANARIAAGERGVADAGASLLASYGGMTPAYCSPEQAEAAGRRRPSGRVTGTLTRATDTWSWALTVLEMFLGHRPSRYGYEGADAFTSYLANPPQDPDIPAMPPALTTMLRRCFLADPQDRPRDMGAIADELVSCYADALDRPYPRPEPAVAVRLAESLSNQALSMVDLGRLGEAEQLWQRAREVDAANPHVAYNHGLALWRSGRSTDAELIADLERVRTADPDDAVPARLLERVRLERGDPPAGTAAEPPRRLTGHTGVIIAAELSADGHTAVTAATDGTIRVWDVPNGRCLRHTVVTSGSPGNAILAIDATASRAICSMAEEPPAIWDLSTGTVRRLRTGGLVRTKYVAMSPKGDLALTLHDDGSIRMWRTRSGRCLQVLGEKPAEAFRRSVGFGGHAALTLTTSGTVRLFTTQRGPLGGSLQPGTSPRGLERDCVAAWLSADGSTIVAQKGYAQHASVHAWSTTTGQARTIVTRAGGTGFMFKIAGDGRHALSSRRATVQLWELDTGRCLQTWAVPEWEPEVLALNQDGRVALIGEGRDVIIRTVAHDGPAASWSYPLPRSAAERGRERAVIQRALDSATTLLAAGRPAAAADAIRSARSVPGYRRHRSLVASWRDIGRSGHRTRFTGAWLRATIPATSSFRSMNCAVAMDSASHRILRSDERGTIEVWELDHGLRRIRLEGHDGRIPWIALDEAGRLALSAGEDASVRLWDLPSGRCARVLRGHDGPVEAVAVDAGGRVGFSVGADMLVRVWDLATGKCRAELAGHTAKPTTLVADRDGRYLLTAPRWGEEGPRLWDVAAGRCLCELPLGATTLSPTGTVLLSSPDDGGLHLWDARTGSHRRTLHAPDESGKVGPLWTDGDTAIASREGSGIEVWDLHAGRRTLQYEQLPSFRQVSPDGRFGVSGGFDMLVRVWDVRSGGQLAMLEGHDEVVAGALLADDGHTLASFDAAGCILIWDLDWDYDFTPPPERC